MLNSHPYRSPAKTVFPSQGIEVLSVHQVAFEGFDDGVDFPLRPILVLHKIFDTVPLCRTVVVTTTTFVEELTVLLTHVLTVSSAIFDLHFTLHIGKIVSELHNAKSVPLTSCRFSADEAGGTLLNIPGTSNSRQREEKARKSDIRSG